MGSKRLARLNEQFRREISQILRKEVRDPRVGTPTITGVAVTPDLWMARVFVRPGPEVVLGSTDLPRDASDPSRSSSVPSSSVPSPSEPSPPSGSDPAEELLAGLQASAPFVRRELGKILSLRRIPELRFQLDRSLEHAARIEAVLREVRPADREDHEDQEDREGHEVEGAGEEGPTHGPPPPPPDAPGSPR